MPRQRQATPLISCFPFCPNLRSIEPTPTGWTTCLVVHTYIISTGSSLSSTYIKSRSTVTPVKGRWMRYRTASGPSSQRGLPLSQWHPNVSVPAGPLRPNRALSQTFGGRHRSEKSRVAAPPRSSRNDIDDTMVSFY